jgi:CHAT domain-containing protein/tetratricopeptide (TPR) repeat protein
MTGEHIRMTDLERLAEIPEGNSAELPTDLRDAKEHLRNCAECSELALAFEELRLTRSLPAKHDSVSCPSDEQWFAYAAGIAPEDQTSSLLEHAQRCGSCAEKLRMAVDDMGESEPEANQKQLQSSTAEWQRNLARRMSQPASAGTTDRKPTWRWGRPSSWTPILVASMAGLLVAVVALASAWLYERGTDDALLALAYNQRRLTELRLPGGEPVEVYSPTLGQPETEDVLPLLKLRERAEQHLDRNPNNAYWQQILGRIALVEGNGERAQEKLELAFALDPALPGIKFDRAAAYFEKGEVTQQPSEYVNAADLFSQVIDDQKALKLRAPAYYNRALCWDRMAVYSKAMSDVQNALALERNPAWRSKIRAWLDKLRSEERNSEGRGSLDLDTSPTGFLKSLREEPQKADANYEIYFDHASREWLVQDDGQSEAALRQLGAMGLKHHDAWLHDLLGSDGNAGSRAALNRLTEGLQANLEGNADRALPSLTAAAALFQRSHNTAGLLRAQAEVIYTFQRMGRSGECIKLAAVLAPEQQLRRYAWLYSYHLLEASICRAARGDSTEHLHNIQRCIELSRAAGLPVQVLRERGMLVETLDSVGKTEEALRSAISGLEDCAKGAPCSPMRSYQFQQSLVVLLQEEGLWWAAADSAEAAAHTSELVPNLQVRAYAKEVLGTAETAAGHMQLASDAFSRASTILDSMPNGDAAALYRADWEADRSVLLEREGQLPLALERMRGAANQIAETDNFDVRQRYYTRMTGLLLDAGKPADAMHMSLAAVTDAEHALAATRTEEERLSWEKIYGRGYRLLVESLVAMGKPSESLMAWEWYRSAPYRPSTPAVASGHPAFASVRLPNVSDAHGDDLILVVARLEDIFVVWSLTGSAENRVRMITVPSSPQQVWETARTLTELCSDPYSSHADIEVLGSQLYRDLLSRFDDQIGHTSRLALEVDVSLQRLPFAALTRLDRRYLNDTHALVFLPAWWTLRASAPDTIPAKASALLVEGTASLPNSGSGSASRIPPEYFDSAEVVEHFSRSFTLRRQQASVAQVLKHITQVDVFHYNGHMLTVSQQTGLLLQSPDELFTAANLRGVSLQRCRLAVLATCSSAGGPDESIEDTSNLTHAFLAAGAANVVATLWNVDARASRTMMLQMYDSLTRSMTVAAAIRTAQLKVRSDPATRHPYFWSGVQGFTQ